MEAKAASIAPPTATNTGAPRSVAIIQMAPAIIVTDAANRNATMMRSLDGEGLSDMVAPKVCVAILVSEARQSKAGGAARLSLSSG